MHYLYNSSSILFVFNINYIYITKDARATYTTIFNTTNTYSNMEVTDKANDDDGAGSASSASYPLLLLLTNLAIVHPWDLSLVYIVYIFYHHRYYPLRDSSLYFSYFTLFCVSLFLLILITTFILILMILSFFLHT